MNRRHFFRPAVIVIAVLAATSASAQVPLRPQEVPAPGSSVQAGATLDLTLAEAVRRAVDHNPDLTVVRLGVDVEASRVTGSRSAFEPVFLATFGRSSITTPASNAFFGTTGIDTREWFSSTGVRQRLQRGGGTWNVMWDASRTATSNPFSSFEPNLQSGLLLAFSQPLLKDRKIDPARHQYTIARRNHQSSELRFRESVVQTVAAVKQAYWTLKAGMANVSVQQRSLELAEDLVRQNRSRVTVGQAPPLDLVQAEAEVAQRRENLIRAEAAARDAEDRLRRLIMNPEDAAFWQTTLNPVEAPVSGAPPPDVNRAVSHALNERYDLARARVELDNAHTDVTFFSNQKLPDVRIAGSYRGAGVGGTELLRTGEFPGTVTGRIDRSFGNVLGQLFSRDYPAWSLGVIVTHPIGRSYDEANLARAEVEQRQVASRIASLQLQITEAVRRASRDVQSTAERVEAARAGETLAEQRAEVERRRFESGLSTSFLVTQAQRDLLQAQVNLLQATLDHQSSLVNFEAVQLASPTAVGDAVTVRGADVIAVPAPAPSGLFRETRGGF
jgi:outer membrane protein